MITHPSRRNNKMNGLAIVVVVLTLSVCECQVIRLGRCPDVSVVQDFDANRYLGKWYEDEKFFFIAEIGLKCVSANYSLNTDGSIKVLNSGRNIYTGSSSNAVGRATLDSGTSAKLSVKFSRYQPAGPYWVLATDYDSYSLVWSCSDFYFVRSEIAWILTRSRDGLSESTTNRLKSILSAYNVKVTSFGKTDQTGCN